MNITPGELARWREEHRREEEYRREDVYLPGPSRYESLLGACEELQTRITELENTLHLIWQGPPATVFCPAGWVEMRDWIYSACDQAGKALFPEEEP